MKKLIYVSLFFIATFNFGCTKKTESEDVSTSGIEAHFVVDAYPADNRVVCQATFNLESDDNNLIELSDGDSITCNGIGMAKSGTTYSITTAYAANAEYEFSFIREGESAHTTSIQIPDAPTGISPASGATSTKGQALNVSWTPSTDVTWESMRVSLNNGETGDDALNATVEDPAPETGSVAFGTSQTQTSPPSTGSWSSTLTLTRTKKGTRPENLSGDIFSHISVEVPVTLVD
ncbi:MAG: hypothetical protein AB7O96_06335 [Pseudobdellovibrionaceae bacterium]